MSRIFGPDNPLVPAPYVEPAPVDESQVKMLAALDQLAAAILERPVPIVEVPPVDLGGIVQAVQALKGPATAEEIAEALARELRHQPEDNTTNATLQEVAEALKKLDFRLQGAGSQAYGGGAVSFSRAGMDQLAAALGGGESSEQNQLVPFPHDRIDATYPSATTEAYAYKNAGVTVATVTVTYTDATKASILSVVRS